MPQGALDVRAVREGAMVAAGSSSSLADGQVAQDHVDLTAVDDNCDAQETVKTNKGNGKNSSTSDKMNLNQLMEGLIFSDLAPSGRGAWQGHGQRGSRTKLQAIRTLAGPSIGRGLTAAKEGSNSQHPRGQRSSPRRGPSASRVGRGLSKQGPLSAWALSTSASSALRNHNTRAVPLASGEDVNRLGGGESTVLTDGSASSMVRSDSESAALASAEDVDLHAGGGSASPTDRSDSDRSDSNIDAEDKVCRCVKPLLWLGRGRGRGVEIRDE